MDQNNNDNKVPSVTIKKTDIQSSKHNSRNTSANQKRPKEKKSFKLNRDDINGQSVNLTQDGKYS